MKDLSVKYQDFVKKFQLDDLPDGTSDLNLSDSSLEDLDLFFLEGYIIKRGWQLKGVNLAGNRFTHIPNLLSMPLVEQLHLEENHLVKVADFSNFPNLKDLYLEGCGLTDLPNFTSLPKLRSLHVQMNRLRSVPAFDLLLNLRILELQDNLLTEVPDFSHLKQLEQVWLNRNRLTSLPPFKLPKLRHLYVQGNQLQALELKDCPKLEDLNVMDNNLRGTPDLNPLVNLKKLSLDQIGTTDVSDFLRFPKLTELTLGNYVYIRDLSRSLLFRLAIIGRDDLIEEDHDRIVNIVYEAD